MTHLPHFFHCDEWKYREENVSQDGQLKDSKENSEQGSIQFAFAYLQNFLIFFNFFYFFTSVICDPFACTAKIFWLFFPGKPVGGWIWRSQELTKYQQMLERSERILSGLTSRGVPRFPSSQCPLKKPAKAPLLERISHSLWKKSLGTLPVSGPSGLCLSEDALSTVGNNSVVFEVKLTVLSPDPSLNSNLPLKSGWLLMNFLNYLNLHPHL